MLMGVSLSLLIGHMGLNTQAQGLVKVSAAIFDPADSNQFCYSFVISNKIHLYN